MQDEHSSNDTRTPEQLREHYEIEKGLAQRLKIASKQERELLYSAVYDELYSRLSHHPMVVRKTDDKDRRIRAAKQLTIIRPYLRPGSSFLEIGCGDGSLAYAVAKVVKKAYGIEVSKEIVNLEGAPDNFELIITNGFTIPLPDQSIDLVYSYQVMEHLHPDDALEQLQEIWRVLKPSGRYLCITPNKLNGPHDISSLFDRVATGLHLKEYTCTELTGVFKQAGFRTISVVAAGKGMNLFTMPTIPISLCEWLLEALPYRLSKFIASRPPISWVLGIKLIATK